MPGPLTCEPLQVVGGALTMSSCHRVFANVAKLRYVGIYFSRGAP